MTAMVESVELQSLGAAVQPLMLALPRLLAVFAVLPHFAGDMLQGLVRNALVLVLAMFIAPLMDGPLPSDAVSWLLLVCKESLVGALLGLGLGLFVWAIQSVGDLVDVLTGSGNAAFFDPVAGHEHGRTGDFLGRVAITLFASGGGLLALASTVFDSFRLWPVLSWWPQSNQVLATFALRMGDTLFGWMVKLSAPLILMLLLLDLGFALIGRAAPALNVFQVAQPAKQLLALLVLALVLNIVHAGLQDLMRPDNLVVQFLRAAL